MIINNIQHAIQGEIASATAPKVCSWCKMERTRRHFATIKAWFMFRDTGLCETCQDQHSTGATMNPSAKQTMEG